MVLFFKDYIVKGNSLKFMINFVVYSIFDILDYRKTEKQKKKYVRLLNVMVA